MNLWRQTSGKIIICGGYFLCQTLLLLCYTKCVVRDKKSALKHRAENNQTRLEPFPPRLLSSLLPFSKKVGLAVVGVEVGLEVGEKVGFLLGLAVVGVEVGLEVG